MLRANFLNSIKNDGFTDSIARKNLFLKTNN